MSVCGQTEEDSGAEEMGAPVRDIYEQKAVSKVVRVLTVLAYLLSVSLAAILLSVYYVCVWKSPDLPRANDTLDRSARHARLQADTGLHLIAQPLLAAGGSNTTVSENVTQILANITDSFSNVTDAAEGSGAALGDLPDAAPSALPNATADSIGDDNGGVT